MMEVCMHARTLFAVILAVPVIFLTAMDVEPARAMSFGNHHNNGGGSAPSNAGNSISSSSTSTITSLDAPPYMTPVPEPSSIVLLGSGIFALGWWRYRRHN